MGLIDLLLPLLIVGVMLGIIWIVSKVTQWFMK